MQRSFYSSESGIGGGFSLFDLGSATVFFLALPNTRDTINAVLDDSRLTQKVTEFLKIAPPLSERPLSTIRRVSVPTNMRPTAIGGPVTAHRGRDIGGLESGGGSEIQRKAMVSCAISVGIII